MNTTKPRLNKNPLGEYDCVTSDDIDWQDFKYCLGLTLNNEIKTGYAKVQRDIYNPIDHCVYSSRGYVKLYEDRTADTVGGAFLHKVFPKNVQGHLTVFRFSNRRGFSMRYTHHDNPVNGDVFYVTPCSERTYLNWMERISG